MATFVPWAMRSKEGALVGFEIDVATKVAADMGVEIEFVPTAWSGIIPALLADNFDIIIGGTGAGLSEQVYPSCRHRQFASGKHGRWQGDIPLA